MQKLCVEADLGIACGKYTQEKEWREEKILTENKKRMAKVCTKE